MDVREDIYNRISETLEGIADVRHIDLWNRNIDFIEEDEPWERPAVFVEIMPVRWEILESKVEYHCTPRVALHVVTDWAEGQEGHPGVGRLFSLPEEIHRRLAGLSGKHFYGLDLVESDTNHDHSEILEMIEVYECHGSRIFND